MDEVPRGLRAIAGLAPSVTAFIGRARKGSIDNAVDITNFGDFERSFGGLWTDSTMGSCGKGFLSQRRCPCGFFILPGRMPLTGLPQRRRRAHGKDALDKAKAVLDAINASGAESWPI